MVEVTVDSTGSLVDLRLTGRIGRAAPDAVAAAIMGTIREAKAELADRTQEIVAETIGTDSATGRAIAERVGARLRGDGGEVPPPARGQAPDEGDDNYVNPWR